MFGTRTLIAGLAAGITMAFTASMAMADDGKCEPDKLAEKYPSLAGKTIKIGADPGTPPYVVRDANDPNKLVGFDADLARAVFDCHGIKYEFFLAAWSGILPAVVADQADVFWDNLYYTPERAKQVDYVLYMQAATGALTQKDNPKGIKGYDDFCGNAIAVGVGTVEEPLVRKRSDECKTAGKAEIDVQTYPDIPAAVRLIESKRADIALTDLTVVDEQVKMHGDTFSRAFMLLSGFNIGTAVKNGNTDLNKAIFDGLKIMQANGTQGELMKKQNLDPGMQVTAEVKTE